MQGLSFPFCSRTFPVPLFSLRYFFNGGVYPFGSMGSLTFRTSPSPPSQPRKKQLLHRLVWRGDHMGEKQMESVVYNKRRAEGRRDEENRPKDIQLKLRKLNPVNTISFVQILGTGMDTQDTSPSVLLFFDKQRFIFNAGEGLQRFCTEHKIKLSKIDHVFLSRVCSETAGGIPGLLLTLAGIGEIGMTVNMWGPSDLNYLIEAMKYFIPKAAMVHTHSFGPSGAVSSTGGEGCTQPIVLVDDEVVKISAVLLTPSFSEGGDKPGAKAGDVSVVYVCELPEIKGKFDPKRAKELGLKPGPKYRDLQLGKSVMSDSQNIIVKPSDVMDGSIPGPIVVLVDCPTIPHMHQLLSTKSLNAYYHEKNVNCVIHLTPSSISSSPEYLNWLARLPDAHHIMAGHQMGNGEVPILKSSARVATRLNFLCPQFFPKIPFSLLLRRTCDEWLDSEILGKIVPAKNLLKYVLRPYTRLGLDGSCVPKAVPPSSVIEELKSEVVEIEEAAEEISRLWVDSGPNRATTDTLPGCLEDVRRDDMEVVLLGTGSSQPSKYLNVTSIYVDLFSRGSLLLDCGEGTLGQLNRRFGGEGADEAVRKVRVIWISHIHADHHTGLARVLAHRSKLLKGSDRGAVLVIGPVQLKLFLEAYDRVEDLSMRFVESGDTVGPGCEELEEALRGSGVEALTSVPVVHCPQAFGVVVRGSPRVNTAGKVIPGWTLVYSGDTRPCPLLLQAARHATLLIHEATFEEGMEEEAVLKNHSTTKEALEVGAGAGVYRLLLTHFSQRYPKIPVFGGAHMDSACVGFDFMSVNLADLHLLPLILPYLNLLFRHDIPAARDSSVVSPSD